MLLKTIHFYIILFVCFSSYCFSQVEEQKKDSAHTIYNKIENYSKKRKTTKLLHVLIFKTKKKHNNKNVIINKSEYENYEGKIIRNIHIDNHDPFGFSFTDSTKTERNWLERSGNKLHVKSKNFAIKNALIFKKDKPLDSLLIIESKRLIRSQNYIRNVEIKIENAKESKDSLDVYITTLDSWSLLPSAAISKSQINLQLKENNYLGFGHQFKVGIINRFADGKIADDLSYTIPQFKDTYISTTLAHSSTLEGFYSRRFDINRPFYSPYAKWAAGIYLDEQFSQEMLPNENLEYKNQNFKFYSQDIWAGYSYNPFKGNTERERTANIITAFRLLHKDYKEKPTIEFDSIQYFSNEIFYLGSIGLSSRRFVEDKYIFRDGIIENVPIGDIFAITAGNQYKNKTDRLYIGAKIAHGNYYNWGYLSVNVEFGTFLKKSKAEQTAYTFSANYFTNLIYLGSKWKMRQFIKPQLIIGKNRLESNNDKISIDESADFQTIYYNEYSQKNSVGIPGFTSDLLGTTKCIVSLKTQFYPPWEFIGFRFNPYLNINAALLSNEKEQIFNTKLYSSIGIGLIIRNDYLVFNSLQLSFSYYPNIPGQGNNVFSTNALNVENFGLQGFELGKPATVWYQ